MGAKAKRYGVAKNILVSHSLKKGEIFEAVEGKKNED